MKNSDNEIISFDRILDLYKQGYNEVSSLVSLPTDKRKILVNLENDGEILSLEEMFSGDFRITNADAISGWNTSNVTNMEHTFYNCYGLSSLDLSRWDMTSVTATTGMFQACSELTSVIVTNCNPTTKTKLLEALNSSNIGTWVENNGVLVKSS